MYLPHAQLRRRQNGGGGGGDGGQGPRHNPMVFIILFAVFVGLVCLFFLNRLIRRRRRVRAVLLNHKEKWCAPRPLSLSQWKSEQSRKQGQRGSEKGGMSVGTDDDWEEMVCAICLEAILDADLVRRQRCSHVLHAPCAADWYARSERTCPLCRL